MRNPQSSNEGYLFVDHRASPGLPEWFARKMGYDPAQCAGGKLYEAATLTCCHCQATVVKNPERVRGRENCQKCGGTFVCDACYALMQSPDYVHIPFKKVIDDVTDGRSLLLVPLINRSLDHG